MALYMDAIQSERPQTLCTEAPAGVEIDGIQLIVTICVLAMSFKRSKESKESKGCEV